MTRIVLILCFGLMITRASSQELSLSEVLSIAMKNNLGVRIAQRAVDIAEINNSYGFAGGLPFVAGTASGNQQLTSIDQRYSNPANNKSSTNARSTNISAGVAGDILLYNGGRVHNAKHQYETAVLQTRQQLDSRVQALFYNVMLKYFDIVRQESYAKTLATSIEVSKQKLDIVKKQQQVGVANDADLFQSQVDLNTQIQNLQAQQLVVDQGKTDLLTLLTLKPDSVIAIRDTILVDNNIQLDSILGAVSQNPDVQAAYQQVAINQFIEKEVGAQRYPSFLLNAGYNFSHTANAAGFSLFNQSYGPYIGLGLTIPIFNGYIYRKQEQVAGINVKIAGLQRDTLLLGINSSAVKSWQAYKNNLQQLETAKETYDLSQKLLDLVLKRFQYKQATIVDVKNAQQSFENAGFLMINISYAAKVSEIQLRRLANKLP
ncbi:MAG: TolC family protein [Bacteroidota bacterium]|nr:TolC family protein [Bacteroidota bacterium]MDP4211876.1 TolC family protein [Bacteroidota bacterium]MDP4248535.1 TolC family protein [Bacteroidota bacterium]